MSVDGQERRARAALTRLTEPDSPRVYEWLAEFGAAGLLDRLRSGDPSLGGDIVEVAHRRMSSLDVDRDLDEISALGGRFVCPGDAEWPPSVDDLGPRAPVGLWVRGVGHLAELCARSVSIVGSRAMTDYGAHVAGGFAADLADLGWVIVSGGAAGIDAAAHRGSLVVGAPTVAVLACGVDVTYPRGHDGLFAAILERGAIVSELPPGCAPHRGRFLIRNRVIAALSAGTVVIEAALRSGARSSATHAVELGRPLMVVPGLVTSETSAGCHALLRGNPEAVLVTSTAEIVEVVGVYGVDLAPVLRGPVHARDGLSPEVARVLDALPVRRGIGPARIASTAGLPLGAVQSALGQLDLLQLAEEVDGGWRLAPSARGD